MQAGMTHDQERWAAGKTPHHVPDRWSVCPYAWDPEVRRRMPKIPQEVLIRSALAGKAFLPDGEFGELCRQALGRG